MTDSLVDRLLGPERMPDALTGLTTLCTAITEIELKLAEVMERCGKAMFDDSSCDFGGETWNRSANSFEADAALSEVAEILGINGPEYYEARLVREEEKGS